jgi:hypothetical protein
MASTSSLSCVRAPNFLGLRAATAALACRRLAGRRCASRGAACGRIRLDGLTERDDFLREKVQFLFKHVIFGPLL